MTQQTYDNCNSTTTHNIDDEVLTIEENIDNDEQNKNTNDKEKTTDIVYKFGIIPTEKSRLKEIDEQLKCANHYYNDLVQIENEYRTEWVNIFEKDEEYLKISIKCSEKEQEIYKLQEQVAQEHIDNQNRKTSRYLTEQINKTKNELKELYKTKTEQQEKIKNLDFYKEANNKLKKEQKIKINFIKLKYKKTVHSGTRGAKTQAFDAAKSSRRFPKTLRFKKFNKNHPGSLTLQTIDDNNKIYVSDIIGKKYKRNLLQIEDINDDIYNLPRGERERASRKLIKFRINSDPKNQTIPIWAEFVCIFHRPIPRDAILKYASITKRVCGFKTDYTLELTLGLQNEIVNKTQDKKEAIAIDLGWRKVDDDTIRIATSADSNGELKTYELPKRFIEENNKINDLKEIRQKEFNKCKELLVEFCKKELEKPEWFIDNTKFIDKFKSPSRLCDLIDKWRNNRFKNDEQIFDIMHEWFRHERHLYNWESNQRRKFINGRDEFYRIIASKINKEYQQVFIEDFNINKVTKKPEIEKNENDNKTARANRFLAAPSEFINACKLICKNIKKVNPAGTSKKHHKCGTILNIQDNLKFTCPVCNEEFDRDENAAKNILQLGLDGHIICERPSAPKKPRLARRRKKDANSDSC